MKIQEKVLKKLRNYGYTTMQEVSKAEFIINKTLAEVEKIIDKCKLYWTEDRVHNIPCINPKELKQKLKEKWN